MSLKDEIKSILGEADHWDFSWNADYKGYNDEKFKSKFVIDFGSMYQSPNLNFSTLLKLSDLLGTEDIDVDDYAQGGCETCDYGSDYGHKIQVYNATKRLDEIASIVE